MQMATRSKSKSSSAGKASSATPPLNALPTEMEDRSCDVVGSIQCAKGIVQSLIAACDQGAIEAAGPFSKNGVAHTLYAVETMLDKAEEAFWHEGKRYQAELLAGKGQS